MRDLQICRVESKRTHWLSYHQIKKRINRTWELRCILWEEFHKPIHYYPYGEKYKKEFYDLIHLPMLLRVWVRVRLRWFKSFGRRTGFSVHRYGIKKIINRKWELGGSIWHKLHQNIYTCPKNKTHSYEFHNLIRIHDSL